MIARRPANEQGISLRGKCGFGLGSPCDLGAGKERAIPPSVGGFAQVVLTVSAEEWDGPRYRAPEGSGREPAARPRGGSRRFANACENHAKRVRKGCENVRNSQARALPAPSWCVVGDFVTKRVFSHFRPSAPAKKECVWQERICSCQGAGAAVSDCDASIIAGFQYDVKRGRRGKWGRRVGWVWRWRRWAWRRPPSLPPALVPHRHPHQIGFQPDQEDRERPAHRRVAARGGGGAHERRGGPDWWQTGAARRSSRLRLVCP